MDSSSRTAKAGRWTRATSSSELSDQPAAERAHISVPATFLVMRRTTATKQQRHGGVKSVQGQLRHSTVQTTFEQYAQGVPAFQQEMVDSDWEEVQMVRKKTRQSTGGQIGGQKGRKRVPKAL